VFRRALEIREPRITNLAQNLKSRFTFKSLNHELNVNRP